MAGDSPLPRGAAFPPLSERTGAPGTGRPSVAGVRTLSKRASSRRGHGACFCETCNSIWEFEPRDFFVGELYCPVCATRHIAAEERFGTLEEAIAAHPQAKVYRD